MNPTLPRLQSIRLLCLLTLACAGMPGLAAPGSGSPETLATPSQYQRAQARCMRMPVHGDRANCLSEASTAHAATLSPTIDPDPGRYTHNALERCKPLREPDRADCVARMQGRGTSSGSVAGGGIYRELVTRESAGATP